LNAQDAVFSIDSRIYGKGFRWLRSSALIRSGMAYGVPNAELSQTSAGQI